MLDGMDGLSGRLAGSVDRERAVAMGRRVLEWGALAVAMFLVCQVRPAQEAPFGMAFLAAAFLAGKNAVALLAGCLAGVINGGLGRLDLRLPIGAAVVLGGGVAAGHLLPAWDRARAEGRWRSPVACLVRLRHRSAKRYAPQRQARSPNDRKQAVCSALAGLGVLIPGMAGLGEAVLPSAGTTVAASVAAVAVAPFFHAALTAGRRRRWLAPEERSGALMLMGLMAAGLAGLSPPVALCVGGALAQLLYPGGALAGVGIGGALTAMGMDLRALALAAAAGAMAQLCASMKTSARAACACGATLAVGLLLNAPQGLLLGAGASSLLIVPMPRAWAEAVARLARPAPDVCDPRRLAARLRRESAGRLRALGDAFGDLAEDYGTPVVLPDEQALIQRLRQRLCAGCKGYECCWSGGRGGGARLLCDLITRAAALVGEESLFDGQVSPELARRCSRWRLIPERVQDELEGFARARREGLCRAAENRLVSAQFAQAGQLVRGLARRQARSLRLYRHQAVRAASALERTGIEVDSVMALDGRGVEIAVAMKRGRWTLEQARAASAALSEAFGRSYTASGPLGRELRFIRRPRLRVNAGIRCAAREAGAPSGDSHLTCMLDDERLLTLICDGMGSGEAAHKESAVATRLLGRFLRAGASCSLAVETVNTLLMNRGGEDMFATVDLLILNLSTGDAEFVKLAACPTLIVRDGKVLRVEGDRLPLGILERVRPGLTRAKLQPGDALLMATDGVMDAAGEEALAALLSEEVEDISRLARRAIEIAQAGCEQNRRDDMTAVCLKVEAC